MYNRLASELIEQIIPRSLFADYDFDEFSKALSFKKNDEIPVDFVKPENLPLVVKGVVMVYIEPFIDEKLIIDFKYSGQLLRPAINVDPSKVGQLKACCLADTELILMDRGFICSCTFEDEAISAFYYKLLEEELGTTYLQLKLLKEANLVKRYQIFLKEYKHIYNYVTDRMVSNYLGVHYTTLSRIKRKALALEYDLDNDAL